MRPRPGAANAALVPQTVYGPDRAGEAQQRTVAAEITSRLTGGGTPATVGANGDPSTTFNGAIPQRVQELGGLAYLSPTPSHYRDTGANGLEDALPDATFTADPARRALAEQLARFAF